MNSVYHCKVEGHVQIVDLLLQVLNASKVDPNSEWVRKLFVLVRHFI